MEKKACLKLGGLLVLALLAVVGIAGYGRQLREDLAHHKMMEAPEDRRVLAEMLQIKDIRQRLLAEEAGAPGPGPAEGPSGAEAPDSASYGSSAPSSTSSSSSSSSSSGSSSGSSSSSSGGGASLGGIVGRKLMK